MLFTENETNVQRLFGVPNPTPYAKDAFHEYVIQGNTAAVNDKMLGTKAAPYYRLKIPAHGQVQVKMRLYAEAEGVSEPFADSFDETFQQRIAEADAFYRHLIPEGLSPQACAIARQAYAGLLWSKQFYYYVIEDWLEGDPNMPPPPASRKEGRNSDWRDLFNRDVLSMPDTWEYPWYASWDTAFHMICFARLDPEYTKNQLILFLREWYMHPSGKMPAYEFNFSDVNPPVHAWACWRVYKITGPRRQARPGVPGQRVSEAAAGFHLVGQSQRPDGPEYLLRRLSGSGQHRPLRPLQDRCPAASTLQEADATAWMAFFCGTMLSMALELAQEEQAYEDMASKFFEHYVSIASAINTFGGSGLWDETDGFYYDQIRCGQETWPLRVRSLVGLLPLIAVEIIEQRLIDRLPGFKKRMQWFLKNRRDLAQFISYMESRRKDGGRSCITCWPSLRSTGSSGCCGTCSTRTSSCRPSASAPCPSSTRTIPSPCGWAASSTGSSTGPASRKAASSAATPTGADRSGFPAITC